MQPKFKKGDTVVMHTCKENTVSINEIDSIKLDVNKMVIVGYNQRLFNAFISKSKEFRYKWLSKRKFVACPMMDKNGDTFYYPSAYRGLVIHISRKRTKYKTANEAYKVAQAIKTYFSKLTTNN